MSPAVVLDRGAIEARLPHREPFLFLDRAIVERDVEHDAELVPGAPPDVLTAEWCVPPEAAFFRGHYPGNPVTPGVILCEHVLQAAAVLLAERGAAFGTTTFGTASDVPVVARIEKARFRRRVRPGEQLRTEVRLVERVGPAFHLAGRARVADEPVLSLECVLMLANASADTAGSAR